MLTQVCSSGGSGASAAAPGGVIQGVGVPHDAELHGMTFSLGGKSCPEHLEHQMTAKVCHGINKLRMTVLACLASNAVRG